MTEHRTISVQIPATQPHDGQYDAIIGRYEGAFTVLICVRHGVEREYWQASGDQRLVRQLLLRAGEDFDGLIKEVVNP